jgi:hypothetical protein
MLLFNIVVPSSPRRSVLAALAASSSVPAMAAVSFAAYPPPVVPNAVQFFFLFVFPYLLVVVMAYVGARVLFALGDEVRKARELGSYRLLERLGQGGMGEGLARTSSPAGEAGCDQAHSSAGPRVDHRIRSRESVRARGASDREPALTAHREPLRLRHRGRWDVLLRDELPIPKELDAIVLACLAKDPSDRPQTARELARRLEAVPVTEDWTPELARAWWQTHQPAPS